MHIQYIFVFFIFAWLTPMLNAQRVNPFDVVKEDTIIQRPSEIVTDQKLVDTIPVQVPIPVELIIPQRELNDSQYSKNPFDVNHQPKIITKAPEILKEEKKPDPPILKEADKKPLAKKPKIKGSSISFNIVFWFLGISLLIFTLVINIKRKTFINLYRSIFNDNYLNLVQREENGGISIFFTLLYICFFLNATIFIYLSVLGTGGSVSRIQFFYVLLGLIIIYLFRHLIMGVISSIFPFHKTILQYNFTIIVFNCLIGIILFPLNAFYAYSPISKYMFFIGIGVFCSFYLIRQLRGFFLAMRISGINLFHFFIYLCTCEIAPLLIIYKFISDYNSAI